MPYHHDLPGTIREGYHPTDKAHPKRKPREEIPGVFRPERTEAEGLPGGNGLEALLAVVNAGGNGDHPLPDAVYGRIGGSKDTSVGRDGPCFVYEPGKDENGEPCHVLNQEKTLLLSPRYFKKKEILEAIGRMPPVKTYPQPSPSTSACP